uniref:Uncharacterized protein n=1 Tax=Pundamilia nyererei TaxID=303518 RepID=A0A3B4FN79_9CICH
MGTLGQWMTKMKMASRLTMPPKKVPPPPAGTTIYPERKRIKPQPSEGSLASSQAWNITHI